MALNVFYELSVMKALVMRILGFVLGFLFILVGSYVLLGVENLRFTQVTASIFVISCGVFFLLYGFKKLT